MVDNPVSIMITTKVMFDLLFHFIVREKSLKNEMNRSKNKPDRFSHFWNPQDL